MIFVEMASVILEKTAEIVLRTVPAKQTKFARTRYAQKKKDQKKSAEMVCAVLVRMKATVVMIVHAHHKIRSATRKHANVNLKNLKSGMVMGFVMCLKTVGTIRKIASVIKESFAPKKRKNVLNRHAEMENVNSMKIHTAAVLIVNAYCPENFAMKTQKNVKHQK